MPSKQSAQANQQKIGKLAEKAASAYLQQQGLRILTSNFQCYVGEIDLIMQDKNDIVFVEVRHRGYQDYGSGLESVNYYKMRKLIKTATYYLQKTELLYKVTSRFDIISMSGEITNPKIEWVKNAFSA
jgi:putative endonuclease